jgi:DNA-nicking Smr family endonuclease
MKAKSYGLADLTLLKKDIERETRATELRRREQKEQLQQEQRQANEFKQAVQHVTPLKSNGKYIHPAPTIKLPEIKRVVNPNHQPTKKPKDKLSDGYDARHLRDDELGVYLRKGIPETLLKKLQKGHWPVSLRLDLHGKTNEEARIATNAFLYQACNENARVVSIIHGQGHGSRAGHAVLKQSVKNWLVQNNNVLAFCAAPINAGGHGAVLILLHKTAEVKAD